MNIVLMGCPGAGKGTQAAYLCERLDIPQISTGDILRGRIASGSAIGRRVKAVMDAGELVSDDIIIDLVEERIEEPDCARGFLFDGFPRTIPQARAVADSDIALDVVVDIVVPDDEVVRRMSGRRVHLPSGRTYHIDYKPPNVPDTDDVTGEPLVQRPDDAEETVRGRLAIFHSQTRPLVDFYVAAMRRSEPGMPRYIAVDGLGTVEEIRDRITAEVG